MANFPAIIDAALARNGFRKELYLVVDGYAVGVVRTLREATKYRNGRTDVTIIKLDTVTLIQTII